MGGGQELLQPNSRFPTRPFLGAVSPCRLPAEGAALGSSQSGFERLSDATPGLHLGLPLSKFREREVAGVGRSTSGFSTSTPAQPERGCTLCPFPHPRDSSLQ